MPAVQRAINNIRPDERGSARAMPERGASLRLLRQWLMIVFFTATMERAGIGEALNASVRLHKQMWATSKATYDRVHDLTRPSRPDTIATMRVERAPFHCGPPGFNESMSGGIALVLWAGTHAVENSSKFRL